MFTVIGMFIFLAVGRQQRAFVAGVFGLALVAFMSFSLCAVTLWRDHESLNKDHAFVIAMLFLWLVVAPLTVGSFISWIRRHDENAAMRCSEPGVSVAVAIIASRGPGR